MSMFSSRSLLLMSLFAGFFAQAQPAYPPAPGAAGNIIAVEWFIDHDPGFGHGIPLPVAAAPDLNGLTGHLPLTGVAPGIHHLFIRSVDNTGNWSLTAAAGFVNLHPSYATPASGPATITALEVAFDTDPGIGHATRLPVSAPGTDLSNLALTLGIDTLPPGTHRLYLRSIGNITSLSEIVSFSNNGVLPLTWLYVRGEIRDNQSHITWATSTENNTKEFEIQHHIEGKIFQTIAKVPAAGNSSSAREYEFTHSNPAPGMNYYRIRQVDVDGKATYSSIVALSFRQGDLTALFATPNPVRSDLALQLPAMDGQSTLTLFNTAGQPLLVQQIGSGAGMQHVDMTPYSAGVYIIRLHSNTRTASVRIVKE